jgi:flagellar L-ring protein precursor FlgH
MQRRISNILLVLALAPPLSACLSNPLVDRVAAIPPTLPPEPAPAAPTGSIYLASVSPGRMWLAEDRKARNVGDMLTIVLVERMEAEKSSSQTSARTSDRSLNLPDKKPFTWISDQAFNGGSQSNFKGEGTASQSNKLSGEFTVTVTRVLPNGALMVAGDRRVMLNRGEEQVQLSGLVRPQDIGPDNRVPSTRVADARLRYSGTGELAQQSKQGWLNRFFDRINPF